MNEFQALFSATIIAQKMKFSIKDLFSKCYQIRWKLRIWSHLLKKSLMENFIFCAVYLESFLVLRCLDLQYVLASLSYVQCKSRMYQSQRKDSFENLGAKNINMTSRYKD